ncbi:E3 ubiquitin-protein ligase Fancl [Calliphora vicina]|uniref:E3 ubiquitin-protein ligase Fancl n=1 Tax=Calliphora vicina TaxID=7373 RepID=UPI00325BB54F
MNESNGELSDIEKILLKYPGLVKSQSKNKEFVLQGPLKVNDIWLNIKIFCPNFPRISNFQLQVQQSFNIRRYTSAKLDIPTDWSVEELIDNLSTLVQPVETPIQFLPSVNDGLQTNIYSEIAKLYVPSEYEIVLNDNCSLIRFKRFALNEQHYLEVALPSLQILEHSLPTCIDWYELLGKATSLTMMLQQYKNCLDDLRPFYENFTDIDELCHVVQPPLPTSKANWRLFVLKDKVYLKVQFADPFSPLSSMSVYIIGPTQEVTHLRRVYSEGLRDWDAELDVHKNLLRIFDLCFFPMTPAEGSQTSYQYCNICYCYKLEHGEIPIVSCDNNHCSLIFHAACLKEWFNTLADGKTFLDVAFGACPFCKAKLSTSFQEILA